MARIIYCLLFLILFVEVECKFKSLYCTLYDKDYGEFTICKLKAIRRTKNSITLHYKQISVVEKVMIRVEILKRANGWRPFLYDISVDMCDFLVKRNNPILNIAFSLLKPYLNTNYSCPLKPNETLFCDNFHSKLVNMPCEWVYSTTKSLNFPLMALLSTPIIESISSIQNIWKWFQ